MASLSIKRGRRGSSFPAHAPREMRYADFAGFDPGLTSLDVYEDGSEAPKPIVIFVHGGGWREGDKSRVGRKAKAFTEAGYLFVSTNYRLHPQAIFPAHAEDVGRAVSYVRANSGLFGGDPGRIFVMGTSAGAHIASLLATDGRYLAAKGLSPAALSGIISLDTRAYDIPLLMSSLPRGGGRLYRDVFGSSPRFWAKMSPVFHVGAGRCMPPFLIAYTGSDPNREIQSRRFAQRLGAAGVPAWLVPATDKTHAGIGQDLGKPGDPVTETVLDFLAQALAPASVH